MKFQVPEPAEVVESDAPVTIDAAVIDELTGSGSLRPKPSTDRWLALVVAVCAGLVGLGFAGHTVAPPPPPVSSVQVSSRPTGDPSAPDAQPSTRLVIAPSVEPVSASPQLEPTPNGWRATATVVGPGSSTISIDGTVPSTVDEVAIAVRTLSGRLLALRVGVVAVDDERPASSSLPRWELGTFHVAIDLPGTAPAGGWQVDVGWRDPSNGSWGSSSQLVPATAG